MKSHIFSKNKFKFILRLILLAAALGAICGFLGSAFSKSIALVTELRNSHGWLLYLLPLGGLASVAIYKLFKVEGMGTNHVFKSIHGNDSLKPGLLPSIFSGSVISHLFGASAGREGAALQIGGTVASAISKILHLDEKTRRILTVCGMGATFSAVFGTPLGACIFALEAIKNIQLGLCSAVPALISSIAAYAVAHLLGTPAERFEIGAIPELSFSVVWRAAAIAVAVGIIGFIFCHILHAGEHYSEKLIKNPYIRIFLGGTLIVILSLLSGSNDYNGGGVFVIDRIFDSGSVLPYAFLLKILFTVISAAACYKGGEIIPSFFIGATAGSAMSGILGISAPLGAATGMAAIFASVTKCPIASCILCVEMFGFEGIVFFIISSFTGALISGKVSLFSSESHFKTE